MERGFVCFSVLPRCAWSGPRCAAGGRSALRRLCRRRVFSVLCPSGASVSSPGSRPGCGRAVALAAAAPWLFLSSAPPGRRYPRCAADARSRLRRRSPPCLCLFFTVMARLDRATHPAGRSVAPSHGVFFGARRDPEDRARAWMDPWAPASAGGTVAGRSVGSFEAASRRLRMRSLWGLHQHSSC
jgi:hypothetical protein